MAGAPAPVRESKTYALHPTEVVDEEPWDERPRKEPARHRLPLCPRCHRPVGWKGSVVVPTAGTPFDPTDEGGPRLLLATRGGIALGVHRGRIDAADSGKATPCSGGALAVCTGPLRHPVRGRLRRPGLVDGPQRPCRHGRRAASTRAGRAATAEREEQRDAPACSSPWYSASSGPCSSSTTSKPRRGLPDPPDLTRENHASDYELPGV